MQKHRQPSSAILVRNSSVKAGKVIQTAIFCHGILARASTAPVDFPLISFSFVVDRTHYFHICGFSHECPWECHGISAVQVSDGDVCMTGKEIRSILDEKVAQLYWDLDGGFTALAWLLPAWVPLPSFQ